MRNKLVWLIVVFIAVLLAGPRFAFAFNLWEDVQKETQWTLGSSVAAGTSVALRHDDSSGLQGGEFVGSALAQVSSYRFLSLWGGGTFIPQADKSLKAVDTVKVGFNLAYLFKGFANQPPEFIKNLVVGPSLTMPLFTTPHVVIPFFDLNYQFGGAAKP